MWMINIKMIMGWNDKWLRLDNVKNDNDNLEISWVVSNLVTYCLHSLQFKKTNCSNLSQTLFSFWKIFIPKRLLCNSVKNIYLDKRSCFGKKMFSVVETIENECPMAVAVRSRWLKNGWLYWPPGKNIDRKTDSIPQANWSKHKYKLLRTNIGNCLCKDWNSVSLRKHSKFCETMTTNKPIFE